VEIDGVTHSGAPILANGSPFRFDRPPPRLGEHTGQVLDELDQQLEHRS
jgi:crotonobetainyl-CoA:carnitine CoA-transferase CaiB-like acyl-CoA transferase